MIDRQAYCDGPDCEKNVYHDDITRTHNWIEIDVEGLNEEEWGRAKVVIYSPTSKGWAEAGDLEVKSHAGDGLHFCSVECMLKKMGYGDLLKKAVPKRRKKR